MDPELLPKIRIRNFVPDPDPAKHESAETWVGSDSAWIRNFCLDPDPEVGKFRAGSGINHSGSTALICTLCFSYKNLHLLVMCRRKGGVL